MSQRSEPSHAQGRARRVLLERDPFRPSEPDPTWRLRGMWPASWVAIDKDVELPAVVVYACDVEAESLLAGRIHVSADERYDLFLDGERIGRGPERGMLDSWHYESFEIALEPGRHVLAARVWSIGEDAPYAQISLRHGLLVAGEGALHERVTTGLAPWRAQTETAWSFDWEHVYGVCGPSEIVRTGALSPEALLGRGGDWRRVTTVEPAREAELANEVGPAHLLCPAELPPMHAERIDGLRVRAVVEADAEDRDGAPLERDRACPEEIEAWQAFVSGGRPVTVPPRTSRRILLDMGVYHCVYPTLSLCGGKGSRLGLRWAETLYENENRRQKGNRDEVWEKHVFGRSDRILPNGGEATAELLWWRAGRYLEFSVRTAEEPLVLTGLALEETRYPLEMRGSFADDRDTFAPLAPLCVRSLQMCSHETYMDCPYYEQLMYIGDARMEMLLHYVLEEDPRLARKSLKLFALSRQHSGLLLSRYPARVRQVIPPFSLWWIGMLQDYLLWRGSPEVVRGLLPVARDILDAFEAGRTPQGLVASPLGWNFVDWPPAWSEPEPGKLGYGIPPKAEQEPSAPINLMLVLALQAMAGLERAVGDEGLALRAERRARELFRAVDSLYWSDERRAYADTLGLDAFSRHSQCLAVLTGLVGDDRAPDVAEALHGEGFVDVTVYFEHYLFEALAKTGRTDLLLERLGRWRTMLDLGATTALEKPEPSRSDCHAWGAHPLFHAYATILGLRPAAPGFGRVRIEPRPGGLERIAARMPHPRGWIEADLRFGADGCEGRIVLPEGIGGEFLYRGAHKALRGGAQRIEVACAPD